MSDRDEYQEMIFNFVYVMAIRDAVMQKAYKGEKKWMWEVNEDEKMDDVKLCLKEHINSILSGKYSNKNKYSDEEQREYDEDFYKLAKNICDSINEKNPESEFRFGNAQKLINMMVKYFYIATYRDNPKRECFRYCHCPMDSIMIKKALKGLKNEKNEKLRTKYKTSKLKSDTSWSKLKSESDDDMNKYRDFQHIVSKLAKPYYPIEYDYKNWFAKNTKGDEE